MIFGLISGCVSPIADLTGRMAYPVSAVAIPVVASSLGVIPGIGMHLNAIIDNIAVVIAGMVIADFLLVVTCSISPQPTDSLLARSHALGLTPNASTVTSIGGINARQVTAIG